MRGWRFTLCLQHHAPVRGGKHRRGDRRRASRGLRSRVIGRGVHSLITVKRLGESKPAPTATHIGCPVGALTLGRLRRQGGRERHFPVDGLRKNIFNRSADFRSIAIKDPDLLALFEWATRHYLEQDTFLCSRIFEYLDTDCVGFPEVRQQPQFIVYFRRLHCQASCT